MASQDLIYSVLPRPVAQVEHPNCIVEKTVKSSSLKSVNEQESQLPVREEIMCDKHRIDRRKKEGRKDDRRKNDRCDTALAEQKPTITPLSSKTQQSSSDNDKSSNFDIFV